MGLPRGGWSALTWASVASGSCGRTKPRAVEDPLAHDSARRAGSRLRLHDLEADDVDHVVVFEVGYWPDRAARRRSRSSKSSRWASSSVSVATFRVLTRFTFPSRRRTVCPSSNERTAGPTPRQANSDSHRDDTDVISGHLCEKGMSNLIENLQPRQLDANRLMDQAIDRSTSFPAAPQSRRLAGRGAIDHPPTTDIDADVAGKTLARPDPSSENPITSPGFHQGEVPGDRLTAGTV